MTVVLVHFEKHENMQFAKSSLTRIGIDYIVGLMINTILSWMTQFFFIFIIHQGTCTK